MRARVTFEVEVEWLPEHLRAETIATAVMTGINEYVGQIVNEAVDVQLEPDSASDRQKIQHHPVGEPFPDVTGSLSPID